MSGDGKALKEILGDKVVLFVDDRLRTVIHYLEELEENGIKTEHLPTLKETLERLKNTPAHHYGVMLIDLHLPGIPPELRPFTQTLSKVLLNEGQLLPLWMKKMKIDVPYAFLSVIPHCFVDVDGHSPVSLLDKNSLFPEDLPGELLKILSPSLPPPSTSGSQS